MIKRLIPSKLYDQLRYSKMYFHLRNDYKYEFDRYVKLSGSKYQKLFKDKEVAEAFIIKEYHAVEKGLALEQPKLGFGESRFIFLVKVLKNYLDNFGSTQFTSACISSLIAYNNYHKNFYFENKLTKCIDQLAGSDSGYGGVEYISKSSINLISKIDFSSFVKSRHSVRDFSDVPVDTKLINDSIEDALYTPSVCNRQAWKVFVIKKGHHLFESYLKAQNGNRGFGHQIDTLLIVGGKLSSFYSFEKTQVYVDGGMFAMSLVYALHSRGIATCCLNTSYTKEKLENFLSISKEIDEDIVPIMYIAIGNYKEDFRVAKSLRKKIESIVKQL